MRTPDQERLFRAVVEHLDRLPDVPTTDDLPGTRPCSVHAAWSLVAWSGAPGSVPLPVPVARELGGARLFFQWALAGEPGHSLTTTAALRVVVVGV